jgi:hypothetical protein
MRQEFSATELVRNPFGALATTVKSPKIRRTTFNREVFSHETSNPNRSIEKKEKHSRPNMQLPTLIKIKAGNFIFNI